MEIVETKFEDSIQLCVDGRIDVTAAPMLQESILTAFQKSNKIVLDLEKTQYVSSAGLRAFLIGQKTATSKGGSMKLINVNDSVMEILKVTGFADIITIE